MQLQIKNCSSILVVGSVHEKIARKVIIMHRNGGCTVAKLVENCHLCVYPPGAELSHRGARAAVIFDIERICGMQLRRQNQRHESNGDFPHAQFFFFWVFWPAAKILLAVHAVQSTQTQGHKYCLCEGGCLDSSLFSQFQVYSSLALTNQYLMVWHWDIALCLKLAFCPCIKQAKQQNSQRNKHFAVNYLLLPHKISGQSQWNY